MRLTDEEIMIEIDEYCFPHEKGFSKQIAEFVRYFYENQKCPSCKSNMCCAIKEAIEEHEVSLYPFDYVSFGCKKWESKRTNK